MQQHDTDGFVPTGGRLVLAQAREDGAGTSGQPAALLVVDGAMAPAGAGTLPTRTRSVLLLTATAAGPLQLTARNDHLFGGWAPGLLDDVSMDAQLGDGTCTLWLSGGTRERWTHAFTFSYDVANDDWRVTSVETETTDTITDVQQRHVLPDAVLTGLRFEDFDFAALDWPS